MQWTDEGIVIGVKRHGEASAILELMTREHGRHLGLVRGGFGSRMKPILQTGNSVSATWRARLDEHLGNYTMEPMRQRASNFFAAPHAIYGVTPSGRADAAVARTRSACRALFGVRRDSRPARRSGAGGADGGAFRIAAFDRARLRARSRAMRRDRRRPPISSMSRRSRGGRSRATAGEPWADKMLRLPAFLRDRDAAAGRPRSRRRLCAHRPFSWSATCWSRAGLTLADERAHFIAALLRGPRSAVAV